MANPGYPENITPPPSEQRDRYPVQSVNRISRRKPMRRKYQINRSSAGNILTIREYAVIDKSLQNIKTDTLRPDDYFFVFEEKYDGTAIAKAISDGRGALVSALRTDGLFPMAPTAAKIAESVMNLYDTDRGGSTELFFDDAN
jgi:hypothetical protein